jgi:hypothetical protein
LRIALEGAQCQDRIGLARGSVDEDEVRLARDGELESGRSNLIDQESERGSYPAPALKRLDFGSDREKG